MADPGTTIGEIWFERSAHSGSDPSLLLKLLFTRQPLSIQVHPDDVTARSLGLPNGKDEAWYILAADPGAELVRGLRETVTAARLRAAIADGSVGDLVRWQPVHAHDVIALPAGTIHALGANLVVAELQQRSDTTFRMFDFGRGRPLHVELAVTSAQLEPPAATPAPRRLTSARLLLTACRHFTFERIELAPSSAWTIDTPTETWLLVIDGALTIGSFSLAVGEAVFLEQQRALVTVAATGATALVGMRAAAPIADYLTETTPDLADEARP